MHSLIAAVGHIAVGATLVLHQRFHPKDTAEAIARYRVTTVFWVPTMYVMALEWAALHPVDFSSLRVCISGGASLPWSVAERFEHTFGVPVLSGWGMTEGTPVTGFDVQGRGRPESIGRALEGCEVRVVDTDGNDLPIGEVGELIFRSPSNMSGYYNLPDVTADAVRDGWMWSGDLGRKDDDGFYYIVGRSKDMIIRGGANIYPAEVEDVLCASPDVAEAAVVGLPDERYGESVVAYVTPRAGRTPDAETLLAFCRERLAAYKTPQTVIFVDELPKGATGKILKRVLKERASSNGQV
jgi:long-chain acyl-CoA synthetase